MGILGWKMLLPMAGRVAGKGRSRAVPRAAVTHLRSRMFLSLSWPDASRHCSPPHPPLRTQPRMFLFLSFLHPGTWKSWDLLSLQKGYRDIDTNKLRNRQALPAWFQPPEGFLGHPSHRSHTCLARILFKCLQSCWTPWATVMKLKCFTSISRCV